MGFLSRLFSHMVVDAVREEKREKEQTEKWNATFNMLQQQEDSLQTYLDGVGCNLTYLFDVYSIDNGSANAEVRKMENIRKDVEEYLALGGEIKVLYSFDDLKRRIDVLKYLRKIGQVNRQFEFLDDNKYSVEDKIKAEQEALDQQIALFRAEQEVKKKRKFMPLQDRVLTCFRASILNMCVNS